MPRVDPHGVVGLAVPVLAVDQVPAAIDGIDVENRGCLAPSRRHEFDEPPDELAEPDEPRHGSDVVRDPEARPRVGVLRLDAPRDAVVEPAGRDRRLVVDALLARVLGVLAGAPERLARGGGALVLEERPHAEAVDRPVAGVRGLLFIDRLAVRDKVLRRGYVFFGQMLGASRWHAKFVIAR